MNEPKHTAGPWHQDNLGAQLRAVRISGDNARRIVPAGGPAIAYLPEGRTDIQVANARLIASAPDLLAALRETVDELKYYHIAAHGCTSPNTCSTGKAVSAARAAIRKATETEE